MDQETETISVESAKWRLWRQWPLPHDILYSSLFTILHETANRGYRYSTVLEQLYLSLTFGFITLATSGEIRNATVWRLSVCLSRRYTHSDSPDGSIRRGQRTFRPSSKNDRHIFIRAVSD